MHIFFASFRPRRTHGGLAAIVGERFVTVMVTRATQLSRVDRPLAEADAPMSRACRPRGVAGEHVR
jgi:hypothetical protein